MIALQVILFISIACLFHSYILYPIILKLITRNKTYHWDSFNRDEELPNISILMAAFNEETVIQEKLESILNNDYPQNKIEIVIGSDNSTDKTNDIVSEYAKKYPQIKFTNFKNRQGKIAIINQLQEQVSNELIILTDANVMFDHDTIFELIKYFKDKNIGLVDTKMINTGLKKEGISIQEKSYISREVFIKHREGLAWGSMMGPFGGCYAIRNELYHKVPDKFLVDDFYICLKVIEKNKACINNLEARVFEDVSNNLKDEFHRKIRIATGNFQNLRHFKNLIHPIWNPAAFSFVSHKVLRWLGPFFLLLIIISLSILAINYKLYLILAILAVIVFTLPIYDILLKKIGIHNVLLRFGTHFFTMNLALLIGFIRILKGVRTNVWKPTKRFQ